MSSLSFSATSLFVRADPRIEPIETLDRIHALLKQLSLFCVWISGCALLLSAIMVTLDVISRKLFSVTMSGSDEISGYVFAAATTLSYSYCLLYRSNVRIDALYSQLPRWLRAALDIFGLLLLLFFIAYLTLKAFGVFWTSWTGNSVSATTLSTPLWIPQIIWFAGLLFFVVCLTFMCVYTIYAFVRGDTARVQRLAGAMSAQEEIATETHGLDISLRTDDGEFGDDSNDRGTR